MVTTIIPAFPKEKRNVDSDKYLNVSECFSNTIQGEGKYIGYPSIFLRLQGCTLNCHFCFYENMPVKTSNGKNVKIKDINIGDKLLTLDEDENIVETEVKHIHKSKVDINNMMSIHLSNCSERLIVCTKDHLIYVKNKGWVKACDIDIDDIIVNINQSQVNSYYMKKNNPMYTDKSKDKMSNTLRTRYNNDIKSYERSKELREFHSNIMKKNNPMFVNELFNGYKIDKINKDLTNKQISALYGTINVKNVDVYNLSCSPYNTYLVNNCLVHNCDTLETWKTGNPYTIKEILWLFEKHNVIDQLKRGHHLVITGGSPLKQDKQICNLLNAIIDTYNFEPFVEIETEGVLKPSYELCTLVKHWNCSPKLSNSGMKKSIRFKPDILKIMSYMHNLSWKFVVSSVEDWNEIKTDFIDSIGINKKKIILMPEGQTREELQNHYQNVLDIALSNDIIISDRLHVTIWNKKTGV